MTSVKNIIDKKFIIIVDLDQKYERMSLVAKIFNFFWITFATLLPHSLGHKLLVISKRAEIIKTYSTRYQALEEMYNYNKKLQSLRPRELFDFIWLNQKNPKALRNRLKLFKKILAGEINHQVKKAATACIVSLGSGSARGVVEVLADYSLIPDSNIRAMLVDRDINAINYSKELAKKYGVDKFITYYQMSIEDSYQLISDIKPNIIEMVGILDYFDDEKVIDVLNQLYERLNRGSCIITANINKNLEERFISATVKWKMVHRNPIDFFKVLSKTFFVTNFEIIYEPLMVHGVGILKK